MALFKLLFSSLLLSLVYSAPVDVPTETTNEGHEPAVTISGIEKDVKLSTKSDSFRELLTSSSTDQDDLLVKDDESESLKPNDFVPIDVVKEEQTISQSPSDVLPSERNFGRSQAPDDDEVKLDRESETTRQQGNIPETYPPVIDINQQEDVKPPPVNVDEDSNKPKLSFDQQSEDLHGDVTIPIADSNPFDTGMSPSGIEEADVPHVADRDGFPSNIDPSQGPYDSSSLDKTPESFNEEGTNDETHVYPQSPINAESINEEEAIREPSEFPSEEDTAKETTPEKVQEDVTKIQNEPPIADPINNDDVPIGSDPSQIEDKGPTEIIQSENIGSSFESYDDPTGQSEDDGSLPLPDQSDNPNEDNNPGPSFPVGVDTPEEMVGDPEELPMREEPEPPAILVRSDLVPSMLTEIQVEQQEPQYGNEEIVPLSDDSAKVEIPEEEISNPDNPSPGINFDNRPEDSGPMNIL